MVSYFKNNSLFKKNNEKKALLQAEVYYQKYTYLTYTRICTKIGGYDDVAPATPNIPISQSTVLPKKNDAVIK
jgi:hypothetical protein